MTQTQAIETPCPSLPSYLEARAPHRALAAHVAEFGVEESKALYAKAKEFNQLYFGGKLAEIFIEIATPASPNAYATHQPRTPEGVACVIRIAPSVVADGPLFANDVLLHEMIHVRQNEQNEREPGYQGHGPNFAAQCNAIGARLGLPEVSVKGKDGKPDCAQWPLNVRPVGYYGSGVKSTKAQTKARAPRGSRRARVVANNAPMAPETDPSALLAMIAAGALLKVCGTTATLECMQHGWNLVCHGASPAAALEALAKKVSEQ